MNQDRFSRNGRVPKSLAVARSATGYQKNEVDLRLDRLSDLWKNVEEALVTRAPGRDILVICDSHSSEPNDDGYAYYETYLLGIQRCAGKWRVSYQCVTPHGRSDWRPIMECDRDTRVRMAKPAFIAQLRAEVDRTRRQIIPELDVAIENLETALADLA